MCAGARVGIEDGCDTPTLYEFEKYACTVATLRDTLDTYGVAVLPAVLNAEECEAMKEGG